MLFALKKIISGFLQPLPVAFLLMGAAFFVFRTKARLRVLLVSCAFLLLAGSLFCFVPDRMVRGLERQYPSYDSDSQSVQPQWIVVLGQGFSAEDGISESSRINAVMHARLAEALRVFRTSESVRLIVSIAGNDSPESKQLWCQQWCGSVGVSVDRTHLITDAVDTPSEMRAALQMIGASPFVLVTSAAHIPRSMLIAETLDGSPIAAPCDYQVLRPQNVYGYFIPSARNAVKLDKALHEYIGMAWFRITSVLGAGGLRPEVGSQKTVSCEL